MDTTLGTTDRGELIARVFDHEFKQIGSSDPVLIDKRGSGSVQVTTLPFVIPEGTEEVALRAFLRDPAGNILAKSDFLSWKISAELSIDHIEVVQVIQTRDNTVDLIANKRTVVRVFTKSDDGRPRNDVVVELRGRRGSELGPPMRQTATSVPQPVRGEEDHSHNFVLPPSWSAVGDLLLEAVVNPDRDPPEFDYSDNKKSYTARFEQTQTIDVRTIEICYECGDGTFCATGALQTPELGVRKLFPIEDSKFSIQPLVAPPLYFDSPTNRRCRGGSFGRGADPLDAVAEHILVWLLAREYWTTMAENPTRPFDQLLGWVPREVATWNAGLQQKFAARSALVVADFFPDPRAFWVKESNTIQVQQFRVAHELGHNLGLDHPGISDKNCKKDSAPFFGSIWPFPDADLQEHGYDPRDDEIKVGKPTPGKSTTKDIMTYCFGNRWMSEFYYRRLYKRLRLTPTPLEQSIPRRVVLISGSVERDGSSGSLEPAVVFDTDAATSPSDAAGGYCLELSGVSGVLATHCFDLDFQSGEIPVELPSARFVFVAPFQQDVTQIALLKEGVQLAQLLLSPNPPEVVISSPAAGSVWDASLEQTVSWTASDPDGDPLTYVLTYSADGGASWTPIAISLIESQYTFDAALIAGGSDVRFRVRALDGMNSTIAEAGPIELIQRPAISVDDPVDLGRATVGLRPTRTFMIGNPGSGPLTIQSLAVEGSRFEIVSPAFPAVITAGRELAVSVLGSLDEIGVIDANATAISNAAGQPSMSFRILMTADDGQTPFLEVSDGPLDFGGVFIGETDLYTVPIRNTSLVDIGVTLSVSGGGFRLDSESEFTVAGGEQSHASVAFSPSSLGGFEGELRVRSSDADQPVRNIVLIASGLEARAPSQGPRINTNGVVDAASFQGTVAPGGIGSLFGGDLASVTQAATALPLPLELGGVRVRVDGRDAPLFFVSAFQINFQIPFEVRSNATVDVVVIRDGVESPPVTVQVADYAPGVFINPNTGEPIIQRHPDGALITANNPAQPGDILIIFVTGIGSLKNAPPSGEPSPASPLASAHLTPDVTVGGASSQVFFAGLAPFFVGLGQVNIQLPSDFAQTAALRTGAAQGATLPLVIAFGESRSQPVNLPIVGAVTPDPQPPPMPEPPPDGTSVQVVPNPVDFGQVQVGDTAELSVSIRNGGTERITLSDATSDNEAFVVDGPFGSLTIRIGPGTGIRIRVRFTPSLRGPVRAMLTVVSDDPVSPMLKVLMIGEGM